jgi:hypothetical protein
MFSANHFIVSQTSPHIVPFLNLKRRLGMAGVVAESEFRHRCRQLQEMLPPWVPNRWLKTFTQQWEVRGWLALLVLLLHCSPSSISGGRDGLAGEEWQMQQHSVLCTACMTHSTPRPRRRSLDCGCALALVFVQGDVTAALCPTRPCLLL